MMSNRMRNIHSHMVYPLNITSFVKEELINLLEVGLIERSLSPYVAPTLVVPHKAPPGSSSTETKGFVLDHSELISV